MGRVDGRRWGRTRTFSARDFICPVAGEWSRGGLGDGVWEVEETVTFATAGARATFLGVTLA